MAEPAPPKLYLATPTRFDLSRLTALLPQVLDRAPVACLRLSRAGQDADAMTRLADMLRPLAHAHDIPVVADDLAPVAARAGLDGVHLTDGPGRLRDARKTLGKDAIIGVFCGASRHAGLTAGELGADYVSFGPVHGGPAAVADDIADGALFAWWAEMVEVPVVAEGGLTEAAAGTTLGPADFLMLRDEIWLAEDGPEAAASRWAAYA